MSAPHAVFLCDVSPAAGLGHVSRCGALAGAMARTGWTTEFAGESLPEGSHPDLLVIDHYGRGRAFEQAMRRRAGRIVVIDDLADRPHDCDVLIDYSPGRTAADYAGLLPEGCEVLAGPQYALLRPEFAAARQRAVPRPRKPVDSILMSFGSVALESARKAAARLSVAVDIPTGGLSAAEFANRMCAADLAVGAPGVSALERCCLGLPSLLIVVAENQRHNAGALREAGAARVLGWHAEVTAEMIVAAVEALCADDAGRTEMARAAASVCDGMGAARVAAALHEAVAA